MGEAPNDSSQKYFRPSDRWECGRLRVGLPCSSGPSHHGQCPFHRSSPEANVGIVETNCRPRRSLWWRRRRIARGLGLLLLGLLLLIFAAGFDQEVFAPGALSSPHAQLLSQQSTENRCASCHEINASESVTAFLAKSFSGHATDRGNQTIKCLECHRQEMPQGHLKSPHDLTVTQLSQLTETPVPSGRLTSVLNLLPKQTLTENDLACSQCHKEHQGRFADLTQISSEKCQACHTIRFDSFTQGHPEFTNYPISKTSTLAFDHQSHLEKHFSAKKQTFDCRTCHFDASEASGVGPVNRAVSFEKACATCHDQPLRSSFSDGLIVIHLPSLDRERIEKAGMQLGAWPEEASLMADGKLSPLLQWLLRGDSKNHFLLSRLPSSGALNDLQLDDPAALQLQVDLAAAIRDLVRELADGGQPALQSRLMKAANLDAKSASNERTISNMELAQGASPDIFRNAWENWFEDSAERQRQAKGRSQVPTAQVSFGLPQATPKQDEPSTSESKNDAAKVDPLAHDPLAQDPLLDEEQKHNRPQTSDQSIKEESRWKTLSPQTHLPQGGWFLDQTRLAIVYIPHQHADPLLAAWLGFAASYRDRGNHFQEMLKPKVMSTCTDCHVLSVAASRFVSDKGIANYRQIWQADSTQVKARSFTRFDHTPHLTLPQLTNCTSCHQLATDGMFESIQLSNCAQCHTSQGAGNSCTQCHNYHIRLEAEMERGFKSP